MMEDRRRSIKKFIIGILGLVIFLVLIGWLLISFRPTAYTPSKGIKSKKVHVAIVNEDSGSYYQQKVYHLGKDYVSQLKDTKQNDYVVVPRGIAENGIRKDVYQLVIYIPNNFSNKIMEINNPNPNKLDIQYKINASDDSVKQQCEKIASGIIRDLNSRLIDIYTVGVMGNLYRAQNQVNGIYNRQGQLANQYQRHLSDPIASYSESFPDLFQQTSSLTKSNEEVQKEISDTTLDSYINYLDQITEMNQSVSDLIKAQSETNRNQAEIVSKLLEVNQKVFDEETDCFLDEMEAQNQIIQDTIDQQGSTIYPKLKEDFLQYSKFYEDKMEKLNKQFDEGQSKAKDCTEKLLASIHREYGTDKITLEDILKKQDPEKYQKLQDQISDTSSLQRLLNELPVKNISNDSHFSKETRESIQKSIDELNQVLDELKENGLKVSFDGNSDELEEYNHLWKELEELSNDLAKERTKEIVISDMKQLKGSTFTIQLPKNFHLKLSQMEGIEVKSLSKTKYQIKLLKDISKLVVPISYKLKDINDKDYFIEVTYQSETTETDKSSPKNKVKVRESGNTFDSLGNSSTTESTKSSQMTIQIDISPYFEQLESFIQKQEKICELEGQFVERYAQAEQLAKERLAAQKENALPNILSIDLDKPLNELIQNIVKEEQQETIELQNTLNSENDRIQQNKKDYVTQLDNILQETAKLNETIKSQMTTLTQLKDKMEKLQREGPKNTESEDHTDELQNVSDDMTSLGGDVKSSQNQTSKDIAQFDDIYQQFSDLDQTIQEVEKGNKGLKDQSGQLQDEFQKELAKSGNFSQAFTKVLDTAYKDGVPNEQLMDFISNPLKGKSDEIVNEKTQSYDLTAWILIMAILSWFIAYIVQSIHYPTSYFSYLKTQRSEQMLKLFLQSLLAIGMGCCLAYLSQSHFPLEHSQRLWWYICFGMIEWLMVLVSYNLMHYLSFIGTGISFGVIMIYLMNAYKLIHFNSINVLALFNKVILDVLLNQATFFLSLLMIGTGIILLILFPIVIPCKKIDLKRNNVSK